MGGSYAIRVKLEHLRESLIRTLIDNRISESEASSRIERDFVGEKVRPSGGGKGLYASPEAIAMLDLKTAPPRAPRSWRSAGQLVRDGEHGGNCSRVATKLKGLRDEFIRDIAAAGTSIDEASTLVDCNLIGRRRTGLGSQEALFASPEALRILDDRGNQPKADPSPKRIR